MAKKKSVVAPSAPRAKGYAFIPENRLDLLTKVVKRLQKDHISFDMDEVNEPRSFGWERSWPGEAARIAAGPFDLAPPCPPLNTLTGTLITWPASGADIEVR